ncbi:MAG TPA: Flp pilus assembly protein CpaB [Deltaproteobacteria bacterium]|nr:MAG: Flp pilus assembly protein CpaB [Deltaproteobacteria bacterium GWA2_55_82]OGQ62333.1 MAG: Flp pilus assembly protein CpaB [Deltaproteobacteria bacterium RIFCSPLOWO2_02_FULL_55_12]OIJ75131.1 MAG: Flp pilus assembly protein CpaB [Deltaproteobacteria bacterium GWC2_55_46]HBG47012.1 Flp pilus assembly protein CpaB [Deltaproteobacteria bacterium]HCY10928.1 Flp pilus assembly protein CpaB [Deltaproteobacteria bacterium]
MKPLILLGAGIGVALFTSVLAYKLLQTKTAVHEKAQEPTEMVAVAVTDLSWGTPLKKEYIKTVPFLKKSLPLGYFTDAETLEGRVIISPIRSNEPIFESRLAPAGSKAGGVAAVLSPQKRAMTVKVDKVIGVSGFIHPGSRVDVIATFNDMRTDPVTKIVLENMLVLAAGTEMESSGRKGEKPIQVDVITLEVAPDEAEKLALASTEGKIQLALRNFNDSEEVLTHGANKTSLLSSYKKAEYKKPPRAIAPGVVTVNYQTVEMIKGSTLTRVNVSK